MNKVIDKGFRSCRFVSTIVKHPVVKILQSFYFAYEVVIISSYSNSNRAQVTCRKKNPAQQSGMAADVAAIQQ